MLASRIFRRCVRVSYPVRFLCEKTRASISLGETDTQITPSDSTETPDDVVTHVLTKADATRALSVLRAHKDVFWACDTEVADIDVKRQGPVGNGKVTCVSIYGGPDVDFGDGPGGALWIENIDSSSGLLQEFKDWFENTNYKKVWHNYGFDRHVMGNEGIDCQGFAGDTMHMARLWDTSLDKAAGSNRKGYTLEALVELMYPEDSRFTKTSMKDLFGVPKLLKNGAASKVKVLPSVWELQRDPVHRQLWIKYSARDAVATWWLRCALEERLKNMDWVVDNNFLGNMYDFYEMYLRRFGELLTDVERAGIKVNTKDHVKQAEIKARQDRKRYEKMFIDWAAKHVSKDANLINIASPVQLQQVLFGEYKNKVLLEKSKVFKVEKAMDEFLEESNAFNASNQYIGKTAAELKALLKEKGLKVSGKKTDLIARLEEADFCSSIDNFDSMNVEELRKICNARGLAVSGGDSALRERIREDIALTSKKKFKGGHVEEEPTKKPPTKHREFTIETIGLKPKEFTPSGVPKVSIDVLRELAGQDLFGDDKDAIWGSAFNSIGSEGCRALGALASIGQIDTMIGNFLVPLQTLVDKKGRVHCSLNLNTETGRLSARRPNLQNQPALEKDQYKIRDAFVAEKGCSLIVADYGQLELRLLAHITGCKSMLDAFASGGCFHSRTAVGMYPYIREAVDNGEVLLEWDYSKGKPPRPLVKDVYASERRKAKTLNFSIAYGKTVHGLAKDWNITKEEAIKTRDAWYADRPEKLTNRQVKSWQMETEALAMEKKYVRTLMGRYRMLPDAGTKGAANSHALRAAINTPIQGSAADVVIMAMLKLWDSDKLRKLGWKLVLQIHDEVIMEGPNESSNEALAEVIACMENPFDGFGLSKLKVKLEVDAKCADSWYKAK